MQVIYTRRAVLAAMAGTAITAGCQSSSGPLISGVNCDAVIDPIARSNCRIDEIRSATAQNITVGALIGAAVFGGAYAALTGDISVALMLAMGGAVAGGTAAAARQYISYRIAQANGDNLVAELGMIDDNQKDNQHILACTEEALNVSNVLYNVRRQRGMPLRQQRQLLEDGSEHGQKLQQEEKIYRPTSEIYDLAAVEMNSRGANKLTRYANQTRKLVHELSQVSRRLDVQLKEIDQLIG